MFNLSASYANSAISYELHLSILNSLKHPITEETTTADPPRPDLNGKSDCIYKSNPKVGLITLIVALIRSNGHLSEFKNS